MWIHIVIFMVILGGTIAWKLRWIPLEGITDVKSRRLFLVVAIGGNCLGLFLTMQGGCGTFSREGYRFAKEAGMREKKLLVTIDGKKESVYIQIPEKEAMEEEIEEKSQESESLKESQEQKLREAVVLYNEELDNPDYYYLPAEWNGEEIVWEEPPDSSGNIFAALCLLASTVIMIRKAREEQEKRLKRMEQLLMDYPALVMKFTLLVQAGMTVRKAFQKIASDYKRKNKGSYRWAYEEVAAACNEMDSGVSEAEAYRRFGERCGQIKYKTFATLLIQNLQKGSRRMSDMLEKESMEAWDERKRKARILGEMAATRLLLPMTMMLLVVMAVIMIPAFLSFYN